MCLCLGQSPSIKNRPTHMARTKQNRKNRRGSAGEGASTQQQHAGGKMRAVRSRMANAGGGGAANGESNGPSMLSKRVRAAMMKSIASTLACAIQKPSTSKEVADLMDVVITPLLNIATSSIIAANATPTTTAAAVTTAAAAAAATANAAAAAATTAAAAATAADLAAADIAAAKAATAACR